MWSSLGLLPQQRAPTNKGEAGEEWKKKESGKKKTKVDELRLLSDKESYPMFSLNLLLLSLFSNRFSSPLPRSLNISFSSSPFSLCLYACL